MYLSSRIYSSIGPEIACSESLSTIITYRISESYPPICTRSEYFSSELEVTSLDIDFCPWCIRTDTNIPTCIGDISSTIFPVHISIFWGSIWVESYNCLTIYCRWCTENWFYDILECRTSLCTETSTCYCRKSCNCGISTTWWCIPDNIIEIVSKYSISSTCWCR